MTPRTFIAHKRNGLAHSPDALKRWLEGYLRAEVSDSQMAAWLMAIYFRGMTVEEMAAWTELMWRSGATLPRGAARQEVWIDKHSTGGVGDKTSLILVPLVSAVAQRVLGKGVVRLPMISGRGLGHTGGTLDKLASVPGFRHDLSVERALGLLYENGFFMVGQTTDLAPADRRLYALRDVTATVESRPLIVSSILSKKLAENLDGLVLDVKAGEGAFMKTPEEASLLARDLTAVARQLGLRSVALVTRMDEPLGWAVGHTLEVEECAGFLLGKRRERGLFEVTVELAARMLWIAARGTLSLQAARQECETECYGHEAYRLFVRMFEAQGGNWAAFERQQEKREKTLQVLEYRAPCTGVLTRVSALALGELVCRLGGGRNRVEDEIDYGAGIWLEKKAGEHVRSQEVLCRVYHRRREEADGIGRTLEEAFTIDAQAGAHARSWILEGIE